MSILHSHTYATIRDARLSAPESEIRHLTVGSRGDVTHYSVLRSSYRYLNHTPKTYADNITPAASKIADAYRLKKSELEALIQKIDTFQKLNNYLSVSESGFLPNPSDLCSLYAKSITILDELMEYSKDFAFIDKIIGHSHCRPHIPPTLTTLTSSAGQQLYRYAGIKREYGLKLQEEAVRKKAEQFHQGYLVFKGEEPSENSAFINKFVDLNRQYNEILQERGVFDRVASPEQKSSFGEFGKKIAP